MSVVLVSYGSTAGELGAAAMRDLATAVSLAPAPFRSIPGVLEGSPGLLGSSPALLGSSPGLLGSSPGLLGSSPGLLGSSAGAVGIEAAPVIVMLGIGLTLALLGASVGLGVLVHTRRVLRTTIERGHEQHLTNLRRIHTLTDALDRARHTEQVLIQQAPIGMLLLDLDGTVRDTNRALRQLLAAPHQALIGTDLLDLVVDDDPQAPTLLHDALQSARQEPIALDRTLRFGAGPQVSVHLTVVPLPDRSGAPARLLLQAVDLTRHRLLEQQLRNAALHDPPTGLANRRGLEERFDLARAQQRRNGGSLGLLFVDLDRFKQINDDHGHEVGDRALAAVAHHLQALVRETDLVCRLGGDEFVVLLTDLADRPAMGPVLTRLVETPPPSIRVSGTVVPIPYSVGSTLLRPVDDLNRALRRADMSMFRNKQQRRDGTVRRAGIVAAYADQAAVAALDESASARVPHATA